METNKLTPEPKDKRTKEWKEWKLSFDESLNHPEPLDHPIGLGDVVESITKATGIDKLVKFIAGEDCGCKERKEKLNKIVVNRKSVRCFTEQQYNAYTNFKQTSKEDVRTQDELKLLVDIYAHLFATQYDVRRLCVNCQGTATLIKTMETEIDKIYESY